MDNDDLKQRLDNLIQKVAEIKAQKDFETRYHDGHKKSLDEMERHYREWQEKLDSDLHDYEEKNGQLSELERDLIVFISSIDS